MPRSYYTFARAAMPQRFSFQPLTKLLSINELWDESFTIGGPALLFRLRSDASPGHEVTQNDAVEWCCGLFDSTTRWRACLGAIRCSLQSIRTPALAKVCFDVQQALTSRHQAAIAMSERQTMAQAIKSIVDEISKSPTLQSTYECEVAQMLLRFCFVDNDYELQALLPHMTMFGANLIESDKPDAKIRTASVDVLFSALVLTESFARLNERMPDWLYAPMPILKREEAPQSPAAPPEDESSDDEDDED